MLQPRMLQVLVWVGMSVSSVGAQTERSPDVRAPGVRSLAIVLALDLERARALEWGTQDTDDAGLVATAAALVERRLLAMERSVRVEFDAERRRIELSMPSIDARDRELVPELLRSMGVMEILLLADEQPSASLGIDLAAERAKLAAWRTAHPNLPLAAFQCEPGEGGPHRRLLWCEWAAWWPGERDAVPLLLPARPADAIGAAALARVARDVDRLGYPSIRFGLSPARSADLERLSAANQHARLGFVLGARLAMAPTLEATLRGDGLIESAWSDEEAAHWTETLRNEALQGPSGPLRVLEVR